MAPTIASVQTSPDFNHVGTRVLHHQAPFENPKPTCKTFHLQSLPQFAAVEYPQSWRLASTAQMRLPSSIGRPNDMGRRLVTAIRNCQNCTPEPAPPRSQGFQITSSSSPWTFPGATSENLAHRRRPSLSTDGRGERPAGRFAGAAPRSPRNCF
jgi:hypothetical protein